jgi:nucleoside-diphosphate-sugar epimerase
MKALVTGGGGFLGGAIARALLNRGDSVSSFARGAYPALEAQGVTVYQGDLSDPMALQRAMEGNDVVFHVAAKAGVWGPYAEYHQANVVGTVHVLEACRAVGVTKLVYTSSPSVVFNGRDMENVDESAPYPTHFEAPYPQTKAIAERLVLEANDETLATVALRPHLIWGPGDNHLVPRLMARARAGQLRRIGRGDKLIDGTYIDNAVHAHLLACDRLSIASPIAGKAYFIAQGEPLPAWNLVNRLLATADIPPVERAVPPEVAYLAGWFFEGVHRLLNLPGEPRLTRFVARELSTAHWFNLNAAKRELGYEAPVSMDEGLARLRATFKP